MSAPETTPAADVERWCEIMHDAYEAAAVGAGWETQQASRKPWADVPEANKATMRAAVRAVAPAIAARAKAEALREAARAVSARTTPGHASIGPDGRRLERRAIATMLRARALSARVDEIEAGR